MIKKIIIKKNIIVLIRGEKHFESALKRFKKACQSAGLFTELRNRKEYLKPSEKKKRKREESQKRYHRFRKLNSNRNNSKTISWNI